MQSQATLDEVSAGPSAHLLAFAARLRRLHVRRAAGAAALRILLVAGGPAIVCAWALPSHRAPVFVLPFALALVGAAAAAFRARAVADSGLLRDGASTTSGAGAMATVGDELATWLEWRRRADGPEPMAQWLGREVLGRLPALPASELGRVGRRQLGRLRVLMPLVLLLLLAFWIVEWLAPPWPGVLGGRPRPEPQLPPPAGQGPGPGGSGGGTKPEPRPDRPQPSPADAEKPPAAVPPPPPEPSNQGQPEKPEPPAPLLDLPDKQHFVVPEFVGDGPTRRARVRAAEIAEEGGSRPAAQASAGAGKAPEPPPPTAETFARAAEAAQRARHVPPEERAMVRRFFEGLREAAK